MKVLAFALPPFLFALVLCFLAYLLGRRLLLRAPEVLASPGAASVCTTLGLGVLATLAGALGLLHWLRPGPLLVTGLIVLAFTAPAWPRTPGRAGPARDTAAGLPRVAATLVVLGLVGLVGGLTLLALYPPTDFDSGAYHLAVAGTYAREGAVTLTPFLRFPVGPLNAHVLFALLLVAIPDPATAGLVSVAAAALVGIALYSWASDGRSPETGLLAAALWATSSLVLNRAETASYHMPCALFCVMAVFCFARFKDKGALAWLVLSGTFAGFAIGTYYVGGFFAIALAVAAAWACGRARGRWLLAYVLAVSLAALPWLARNAWYTGNPVWPFLGRFFGVGPFWDAPDVALVAADLHQLGVPRTLANLLRSPYDVTFHPDRFQPTGAVSAAFLIALPLLLWGSRRDRSVRFLAGLGLAFFLAWFAGAQALRYLLPLMALFAVAAARSWAGLLAHEGTGPSPRRRLVDLALAAALLVPAFSYVVEAVRQRGPLPTGTEERGAWLDSRLGGHAAVRIANREPGPVYVFPGLPLAFAIDGGYMGDLVGPGRYRTMVPLFADGSRLHEALRRLGARYLLLYWPGATQTPEDDAAFNSWFDLRYSDPTSELFALRAEPARIAWPPKELLADSGFENDRGPGSWTWTGTAEATSEPEFVHRGRSAAGLGVAGTLTQSVAQASPGPCTLSFWARTRREPRPLQLEIRWRDASGATLGMERREARIGPLWQAVRSRHLGTPRSAVVEVRLATAEGRIFLDDVSLHCPVP